MTAMCDLPELPDGWVYLHTSARLWDSVPDDERVTETIIRERMSERLHGDFRLPRELERLERRDKPCEIAVSSQDYAGKWLPCPFVVNDDGRRCKRHGGAGAVVVKKSYTDLRMENDALRQRLAAIEAERPDAVPTS